ncbi:MAG: hypothetical protein IK034_01880 [Bacilli bacterium]|nr:hypothetical protein [Bacilli bacterium]
MSDFYYLNNYQQAGKMGISRKAFENIVTIASNNLHHVKINNYGEALTRLGNIISAVRPVKAFFKKDGRVDFMLDVVVGDNVTAIADLCTSIQEEVSNSVSMMCETVPDSVEIRVSKEKPAKKSSKKKAKAS